MKSHMLFKPVASLIATAALVYSTAGIHTCFAEGTPPTPGEGRVNNTNDGSLARSTRPTIIAALDQAVAPAGAARPVLPPIPAPLGVPAPGPVTDQPYAPQPILPGGVVIALYPPGSPFLKMDRVREAEQYNMSRGVPGRIQSIVNIHNPSIEYHPAEGGAANGSVIILAAGGGHNTLNVGSESCDFVHFFANYGINTVILRNRLRRDGYEPKTDAVNDALQAIRLVRAHAQGWRIDPNKIGIMGFSAGAELSAPAAVEFVEFDRKNNDPSDPLAGISSRPDFVGLLYPGPSPFTRDPNTAIPSNAPPAFIASAGAGDRVHAIWADQYFAAMLQASIPNVEMHIYGNGVHAGALRDREGTPFGTWEFRFIDWYRDLGFLQQSGVETKAAKDVSDRVNKPPREGKRKGGTGNATPPGK
jgi:endo-1,4-beta-xylanase